MDVDDPGLSYDDMIEAEMRALGGQDFVRIGKRLWARRVDEQIDHVFQYWAMKGASYQAQWGVSVRFVPLLRGKRFGWKRDIGKAFFDLLVDPVDVDPRRRFVDHRYFGEFAKTHNLGRPAQVSRSARFSFQSAQNDFATLGSLDELEAWFRRLEDVQSLRFSTVGYHLAWGAVLIALGRQDEGEQHIKRFCERFEVAPDTTAITKMRNEATAIWESRTPSRP